MCLNMLAMAHIQDPLKNNEANIIKLKTVKKECCLNKRSAVSSSLIAIWLIF